MLGSQHDSTKSMTQSGFHQPFFKSIFTKLLCKEERKSVNYIERSFERVISTKCF